MLAEEQDTIPDEPVLGSEMCAGLDKKLFYQMFAEFEEDVLSGKLGDCNLKKIHIGILDGATTISQQPYMLP